MSDSFEFTMYMNSPLSKEDWNKITDTELEKTSSITFQTPQGRQVKYVKCDVLEKIRAEIEHVIDNTYDSTDYDKSLYNGAYKDGLYEALDIIDKYKAGK